MADDSSDSSSGNDEDSDVESFADDKRRIVDMAPLRDLTLEAASVCRECKSGDLHLTETQRTGLACHVALICSECGHVYTSALAKKSGKFFEMNRQAVMASRCIGKGEQ